jgi:chaperone required for assembly of F1-ATPase
MSLKDLERLCDGVLRKNLPAEITGRIRRLLESGHSPRTILALYRKAGATRKTLAGLAVEAEIAAVAAEIKARRN